METNKKIMIVDDALFMRQQILKTLNKHGYTNFIQAKNGTEGIAFYTQHKPDMVLLDITMPDKSGLEVLKEILHINQEAIVIMCSAVGQEKIISDALRLGAKDFIVKPYNENILISMISSLE